MIGEMAKVSRGLVAGSVKNTQIGNQAGEQPKDKLLYSSKL